MGSSTTSPEYVYHTALLRWLLTLFTSQMGIFAEVGPLNCFVSQQVRALSSQVSRWILLVLPLIPENLHSSSILISNLTPHRTHRPILPRIR
jgi:hypothetical protein